MLRVLIDGEPLGIPREVEAEGPEAVEDFVDQHTTTDAPDAPQEDLPEEEPQEEDVGGEEETD